MLKVLSAFSLIVIVFFAGLFVNKGAELWDVNRFGAIWLAVFGALMLVLSGVTAYALYLSRRLSGPEAAKREEVWMGILRLEQDLSNPFDIHDPNFWAWIIVADWLKHGVRLDLDELADLIGPVQGQYLSREQIGRVKRYLVKKKFPERPGT